MEKEEEEPEPETRDITIHFSEKKNASWYEISGSAVTIAIPVSDETMYTFEYLKTLTDAPEGYVLAEDEDTVIDLSNPVIKLLKVTQEEPEDPAQPENLKTPDEPGESEDPTYPEEPADPNEKGAPSKSEDGKPDISNKEKPSRHSKKKNTEVSESVDTASALHTEIYQSALLLSAAGAVQIQRRKRRK